MECADNAALDDRPEALNRVGVNGADNVLALGVVDSGVRVARLAAPVIARQLISAEQANFVRDRLR
jgi:hypothetical protein